MPRRKVKQIPASELACFGQIMAELEAGGDFEGYDLSTLTLSAKYRVEPTIRPGNINKAIANIERYISINCKTEFDYLVGKARLAKISKISRPTITRWSEDGLIRPDTERMNFVDINRDRYDLELVARQLRAMK